MGTFQGLDRTKHTSSANCTVCIIDIAFMALCRNPHGSSILLYRKTEAIGRPSMARGTSSADLPRQPLTRTVSSFLQRSLMQQHVLAAAIPKSDEVLQIRCQRAESICKLQETMQSLIAHSACCAVNLILETYL